MAEGGGGAFQDCFGNVFCVQRWGMTLGSLISLMAISYMWVDCWQHERLRSLVRRPVAPLLYRSGCNFIFSGQFIIAHLFLARTPQGVPDLGLEFGKETCRNLAFVTQVTLLASECWYFVVSLDVVTDLFFSPFNNAVRRIAAYHILIWTISISMAFVLVVTDEAGQSDVFAWCWRRSFADEGQQGQRRPADFLYLYGPVVFFYLFSLVVWFLARVSLNKGIPRTYRVRERRIQQGKGIVVGFSLYWTVFGILYTIVLFADNDGSKTTGVWLPIWFIFSLLLCSRGLMDMIVWKTYVKANLVGAGGSSTAAFLVRVCCGCCRRKNHGGGGGDALSSRLLTVTDPSSTASTPASASSEGTDQQTAPWSPTSTEDEPESKADEFTDVGLNSALREELLFWTMLGMRTSSQQAHEEVMTMNKEQGHGRMVDAVDIDLRAALHEDVAVRDTIDSANMDMRRSYGTSVPIPGDEEEFNVADLNTSLSESNVGFVDYCSYTFHAFRTAAGILPEAYRKSLARPRNARFKLGGTSGSFIFFSDDDHYVIKQIKTNEFNMLLKVLPSYLKHMHENPDSLLQHMYQLCSCTMYHHTIYFLVLGNVHHSATVLNHELHERYDLKGSWINRNAPAIQAGARVRCRLCHEDFTFAAVDACPKRPAGFPHVPDVTMKDMDLNYKLPMSKEKAVKLDRQLREDSAWLCAHNIVDYSLYLGVHKRSYDVDMTRNASFRLSTPSADGDSSPANNRFINTDTPFFATDDGGIGAVFVEGPAVFYMGIVDILQEYDSWKKLERFVKVVICKMHGDGISCIQAHPYRNRFISKARDITEAVGDDDDDSGRLTAAVSVRDSPSLRSMADAPEVSPVLPLLSHTRSLSAAETETGIRQRRMSVQVVGRSGHRSARSEEAYTVNFSAKWELMLWRLDAVGIRILQQWPLAPRELWPNIARNQAGISAGEAVQVVTPDGCRRVVMLPPAYADDTDEHLRLPMPATELLVNSNCTRLGVSLAKFITAATALEPALLSPMFFLMIGQDTYASIAAMAMLVLTTFSQIPKRFMFRPRPYMVARARGFAKDPTTSFPSRAVTCGTVYATLASFAVVNYRSDFDALFDRWSWWLVANSLVTTVLTMWARVFLGAHYPSDCLFSLPQSVIIMGIAISLFYFEKYLCGSCFRVVEGATHPECYNEDTFSVYRDGTWEMVYGNVIAMLVLSIGGTACVLAASQPPVAFWDKIHYVYGLLLPCMAFRLMFTCPMLRRRLNPTTSVDAFALPNPSSASLYDYVWAAATCAVLALIVLFNRRRESRGAKFAVFMALYVFSFGMALLKRTSTLLPDPSAGGSDARA